MASSPHRLSTGPTRSVTLIAGRAVVHIPAHVRVLEIVGVVVAMAPGALKDRKIAQRGVALRANPAGVAMAGWELRVIRVRERRIGPGVFCRIVAVQARGGEELRIRAAAVERNAVGVVVGRMTADTGGWQRRVIVVDMAIRALPRRHRVLSDQGKRRVVVIKGRVGPEIGVVAHVASCGEAGRHVGRIGRAAVILLMTRVAHRAVQRVVVVGVAVGADARRYRVRSRQLEAGAGVIEGTIGPLRGVVAGLARRR